MEFDELPAEGQAQSGAFPLLLRRAHLAELLEYGLLVFRRDADTGVADGDLHGPIGCCRACARAWPSLGWQRGWQGPYIREKGRPPTARGAWVVALLVDDFLTQTGAKKTAECATALALLLLGRDVRGRGSLGEVGDLSDFYKFRQSVASTAVRTVTERIVDAYDFLLEQDGVRQGDLPSAACSAAQWRARHKTLRVILQEFTPIGVAEWMLQLRIPDELWEPFWGLRA